MPDSTTATPSPDSPSYWAPLEALFSPQHCGRFMFMNQIVQNGTIIYLYKHRQTRRYLNLDTSGRAYAFAPNPTDRTSSYHPIPLGNALAHVLT